MIDRRKVTFMCIHRLSCRHGVCSRLSSPACSRSTSVLRLTTARVPLILSCITSIVFDDIYSIHAMQQDATFHSKTVRVMMDSIQGFVLSPQNFPRIGEDIPSLLSAPCRVLIDLDIVHVVEVNHDQKLMSFSY